MRAFRILFACPQTLFDVSNGATMQCYTMLQTLSKLNFQTASIGGGIFDNPSGQARIPNFKEQVSDKSKGEILVNVDSSANSDNPIRHYFFTGFKSTNWNDITSQEAGKFLFHYSKLLRAFKPDIVIGFGCDALSSAASDVYKRQIHVDGSQTIRHSHGIHHLQRKPSKLSFSLARYSSV